MSWRDNLLPAELDGVPFLFEDVDTQVGRRGQLHEFPGRDEPFAEDLGRHARIYRIRAFVLGENYAINRDALRDVIEAGGEHTFVHPYQGEYQVKVLGRVSIRETDRDGRMAQFDLELTESGSEFPLIALPSIPKIKALKLEALDGLSTKTKFDLLGAIADVLGSVTNGINEAGSLMRKVNGKIAAQLNLIDNLTASIDAFVDEINTLRNSPTALMNKLGALLDSIVDLVTQFVPPTPPPGVRFEELPLVKVALSSTRELFGFVSEATVIPTPTAQSVLEQAAHDQLTATVKAATLASASEALASLALDSAAQAQAIGAELAGFFDVVLSSDLDDAVLETFTALKAATIEHFTEQAIQLPQVASYTPATTIPALVVAYELYGDPDLDDDIIARNKVQHPLFLLGGRALEVLADG